MTLSRISHGSTAKQSIRILIADRNRMGNQLLAESFGRDPRFEVVAVAVPADILSLVTTHQPHVALISADFDNAVKKGLPIARSLTRRDPSVRIVILLETSTRESLIAAFRCGASGVFSRTDLLSDLPSCIERVSQGEIWASGKYSHFLLEELRSIPSCEGVAAGKIDLLSQRELEVAERAAQGMSNKQIGDQLGLSDHTVKNYLYSIFQKLGVSNRFELLFFLFKECNGKANGPERLPFRKDSDNASLEMYLKAAEEGVVAAQFIVGLAHLEGYCVEKDSLSAYYWLRMAEENSLTIRHRSHALVEELRRTVKMHDIEAVEHSVARAVQENELLRSKRPGEFIKPGVKPGSLEIAPDSSTGTSVKVAS